VFFPSEEECQSDNITSNVPIILDQSHLWALDKEYFSDEKNLELFEPKDCLHQIQTSTTRIRTLQQQLDHFKEQILKEVVECEKMRGKFEVLL